MYIQVDLRVCISVLTGSLASILQGVLVSALQSALISVLTSVLLTVLISALMTGSTFLKVVWSGVVIKSYDTKS